MSKPVDIIVETVRAGINPIRFIFFEPDARSFEISAFMVFSAILNGGSPSGTHV